MEAINDPSVPGAHSERQVVLYPADREDPLSGPMEEIKCSIVNNHALGLKRRGDDISPLTPCAKRACPAMFTSTPSSTTGVCSIFPVTQNAHEELDDSLLDLSDEDDSDWVLSNDEIDTLLADDDDDPRYASELSGTYELVTRSFVESETEVENGGASPCRTLHASDTLSEATVCEENLSNYAAMHPSLCQSAINPVEVTKPEPSSVCNVKSSHEFLTAKTVMDKNLPASLSDVKEIPVSQLPCSGSPTLLQPSISSRVDAAGDQSENPNPASDWAVFTTEEDNGVESEAINANGNSYGLSDSPLPPQNIKSDQVLTANATCSSTSNASQDLHTLSLSTAGSPKVHQHHHPAEPESFTSSSIVTAEPKLSTESSGTKQNVDCQKPSETKTTSLLNAKFTTRPKYPSPVARPSTNGNLCEVALTAAAGLPRTSFRTRLSQLESQNGRYCDMVFAQVFCQENNRSEDPFHELALLLYEIDVKHENWQDPANLTKKNYSQRNPSEPCTLEQWMLRNGGSKRFRNIPKTFQRSRIPDAIPFSS